MKWVALASLFSLATAKLPDNPSFAVFPETFAVEATSDGSKKTSNILGRVVVGRVDLVDKPPARPAGSAHNFLQASEVTISEADTEICHDATFVSLGTPPLDNAFGSVVLTTGSKTGTCTLSFTVFDSLRQSSTLEIVVTVNLPPTNRDCILSDNVRTPAGPCVDLAGDGVFVRTTVATIVVEARGTGTCLNPPVAVPGTEAGCVANCVVSDDFGPFGECGCGGTNTRTRTKTIIQQPQNGGTACPTLETDTEDCTDSCPRDCVLEPFSAFSDCTKSCAGGVQTRTRGILVIPANGGAPCPDSTTFVEVSACNAAVPCPVDCQTAFGAFGECSKTCGGGLRSRTQRITVQPSNGGEACPELLTVSEACNTDTCPPTPAPVAASETCKNRCGFIGAGRPGRREDDEADAEVKQFGRFGSLRFGVARPTIPRARFVRNPVTTTAVPQCSCDANCARAIIGINTCCQDIAVECPRINILPASNNPNITPVAPGTTVAPATNTGACVFRAASTLAADAACPAGLADGFYIGCTPC